jgi:nitronate monooxygenase
MFTLVLCILAIVCRLVGALSIHPNRFSSISSSSPLDPPFASPLLSSLLGLKYPLLSSPMAFRTGAAFALAGARAGIMGFVAAGSGGDLPWLKAQLEEVRVAQEKEGEMKWGVGFMNFALEKKPEALDVVLAHRPLPTAVFLSFGAGEKPAAKARAAGVQFIISQAQTVEIAIEAAKYSDILALQGSEAGGHGASKFTRQGLFSAVRQAKKDGLIPSAMPIVLAGGFGDAKSIEDGIAQEGVSGLLMGTRFLAATEIYGPVEAKQIAIASSGKDTHRGEVFDLLAMPGFWPAPFDGRAVVHPAASEWIPKLDSLRSVAPTVSAEWKATGGLGGKPGVNVWAGTGLDAVTKEETTAEVVELIGAAMQAGLKRRAQ